MNNLKILGYFSPQRNLFIKFLVDKFKWVNFLFAGMLIFSLSFFLPYIFLFAQESRERQKEANVSPFFTDEKTKALKQSITLFVHKHWWQISYTFKIK